MKRLFAVILSAALLSGCSTKFEVQSDGPFEGSVNGATVQGSGSQTYAAKPGESAVFQKTTEPGTLKARCKGMHGDGRWKSTDVAYGVVTVSASN